MPFITSFRHWLPVYIAGIVYLLLRFKLKGLYLLAVLLVTVGICDFVNAQFLKEYFMRVRPCRALTDVHLLVHCGLGHSFPSNHAVNNFAAATILAHYFKRKAGVFFFIAGLISLSRVFVGVHYFSDILAGGLEGFLVGFIVLYFVKKLTIDQETVEKIRLN
jgi:undecaprenyl-diphosphatase